MHPKVLAARSWTVVRRLVRAELTDGWLLAGGTGLALQWGHRRSEDLDFFRAGSFDPETLAAALAGVGPVEVQARSAGTLHVGLQGLRLSFLAAEAPCSIPGSSTGD